MKEFFRRMLPAFFIIFFISSCEKDSVMDLDKDSETNDTINCQYPTRLNKLDSIELKQLQNQSPYPLNIYGLFDYSGSLPSGHSSINDSSKAMELAINTLIKYSKFSNITSDSSLIKRSVERYSGLSDFSYWNIVFNLQLYQGLEVLNSEIFIRVMDSVEYIHGHHIKDIFIPVTNLIPKDSIGQEIVGKTIKYMGCGGIEEVEITHLLIGDSLVKKICPIEKEHFIEFRVVWEIPIKANSNSSIVGWYVFVDVLTGEIVHCRQNFIAC